MRASNHSFAKFGSILIPLALFAGLLLWSFSSKPIMRSLYGNTSFYIMALMCIFWAYHLGICLQQRRFSAFSFLRSYWAGITVSLLMTILIFYTVPVCFKILNDETNLMAVSQSMFYYRDAFRISMSQFFNNAFHVVKNEIPNRPLLFPFATYIVHVILGYDYHNAFVLNFITMFAFLSGVYVCARHYMDTPSALASIFLVCAYPAFSIYGTSGGYDLFSTLFFYLSMVLVFQFIRNPNAECFSFLWITLLMLANIRYESIIFFFIIIGVLLAIYKAEFLRSYRYIYTFTPLMLLPYIWQRLLSVGTYENPPNVPLFSFQSFFEHTGVMIRHFFNLGFFLPYSGILNCIALIIICYVASQLILRRLSLTRSQILFWSLYGTCLAVMMVIVLSHFLGFYDLPSQARLFLYFCIFCALSPIVLKAIRPEIVSGRKLLLGAVIVFALYHPIAEEHSFINTLVFSRIHQNVETFLKKMDDPDLLVLSAYSGQFSCMNYGSLTIRYANTHFPLLRKEFDLRLYSRMIVIQQIKASTGRPLYGNQRLDPRFKIKPIKEIMVAPGELLRISAVSF